MYKCVDVGVCACAHRRGTLNSWSAARGKRISASPRSSLLFLSSLSLSHSSWRWHPSPSARCFRLLAFFWLSLSLSLSLSRALVHTQDHVLFIPARAAGRREASLSEIRRKIYCSLNFFFSVTYGWADIQHKRRDALYHLYHFLLRFMEDNNTVWYLE